MERNISKNIQKLINDITKDMKNYPIVYTISVLLFVLYFTPFELTSDVANLLESNPVIILAYILAGSLLYVHPILGTIALLFVFRLVRQAPHDSTNPQKYIPNEKKKSKEINFYNQFPKTVEEEVIENRLPYTNQHISPASFKPTLDNTYGALSLA